jgi:death-on-curing protein
MTDWIWVEIRDVIPIHEAQLTKHGGADGIRDMGALESAMARPQNRAAYSEVSAAAALAASYAFGIAKNRPFVDGNKRTAFVALEFFLELNGYTLGADDVECVMVMLGVADGSISEAKLAAWIDKNCSRGNPG